MRVMPAPAAVALFFVLLMPAARAAAAEPPALARARELYNSGDYDAAIAQASSVRDHPQWRDAATLVVARAHLERFRLGGAEAELTAARQALAGIRLAALVPRDQVSLLVGLGESLFLADQFGAAAELFDTALAGASVLAPQDRRLLLDWWATALDREAAARPPDHRRPMFDRLVARMARELNADPASAVANYWFAVALRGSGDRDRAWNAAIAAWVRARLAPDTTEKLRADLDRFVIEVLIPERVRARPAKEQSEAAAALKAEWEAVKKQWP
jgi:hypothetical protein